MRCSRCGDIVEVDEKFCNKCGTPIIGNSTPTKNIDGNKRMILMGVCIGISVFLLLFVLLYVSDKDVYFSQESDVSEVVHAGTSPTTGKYVTAIVYDNTYTGVSISSSGEALGLIVKDSVNQKSVCSSEIKKVEDEIISKYGITAVNLCEMDVGFAREMGNVFKKIYDEFPSVRGYITNLTLVNASMSENYIAAFMPVFAFATSNSDSTFPWIIKTQVLLNTSYFLNQNRLKSSVESGSQSGHFPKNANIYSPVAHELGHYISFLSLMKNYKMDSILLVNGGNSDTFFQLFDDFKIGTYSKSLLLEAYENFKKDTGSFIDFDEWRGTISRYALAKDNNGNYLYDETIAEAFHDVYLNGGNASSTSKYIVDVLKKRLEG